MKKLLSYIMILLISIILVSLVLVVKEYKERINILEDEISIKDEYILDLEHLNSLEITFVDDSDSFCLDYLGEAYVTAYCSCEKCCNEWAANRPVVNGKTIVYTSDGSIAQQGITIAVDPNVIPYGTKVYIEGVGVRVAQDCGGAIDGLDIDVYYDNHSEAWNSNLNDKLRKVWIIDENI